jgi:flagellar hook assembly protein FlgD
MNTTSDTSDGDFRVNQSTTAVGAPVVVPTVFALLPVVPNPLRTSAAISFDLPEERYVELDVLDVSGRQVATLVRTTLSAGEHVVTWDGHDRSGARAAPGVYLYRLVAGDFTATRKMVVAP